MRHRLPRKPGEEGATLIFVIGFMVLVGLVSAGLATQLSSSSRTRVALEKQRNREYSADGAILSRIGAVRDYMTNTDARFPCPGTSTSTQDAGLNGVPIQVDCSFSLVSFSGTVLRNATFEACAPQSGIECPDSAVIIRAQVHYESTAAWHEQFIPDAEIRTYIQSWSVNP
jgi:hypothetical protein